MVGQLISHYRIEAKLGSGDRGVSFRAWDTRLDAEAASDLNHPNIITIYDIDATGGADFIAMEYVAGHTLHHLLSLDELTGNIWMTELGGR